MTVWFVAEEVWYQSSVQCYGRFPLHLWQKQHKTYCSPGLCWTNMFPVPYDSDKLARVASSPGLLSFQRSGEDRQRLNCTWEQSVKDENSKSAKKKVHCYLSSPGFLHFRGWKWRGGERTITGSGEIENLKRTTHRSENLLSLIAPPKGDSRRRKTRCKKKSAVPTFPRPLLIGQSVRKTFISLKMKTNQEVGEKCKYSH